MGHWHRYIMNNLPSILYRADNFPLSLARCASLGVLGVRWRCARTTRPRVCAPRYAGDAALSSSLGSAGLLPTRLLHEGLGPPAPSSGECPPALNSLELGDGLLDLVLRGARELVHLGAVLVVLEGGHGLDAARPRRLLVLVHVDLDKDHVGHLLRELLEDRSDALARPAPRGGEVDHHELVAGVGEGLVKRRLVREHRHAAAQAEHQVEGRLLLDVVVREGAAVLELLAGEDQALLVGRDALLV